VPLAAVILGNVLTEKPWLSVEEDEQVVELFSTFVIFKFVAPVAVRSVPGIVNVPEGTETLTLVFDAVLFPVKL
jgi:hypothetical protein